MANTYMVYKSLEEMMAHAVTIPGLQRLNLESTGVLDVCNRVYQRQGTTGYRKNTLRVALLKEFAFKHTSHYSALFWEERGWDPETAMERALGLQKSNAAKLSAKAARGELKGIRSLSFFTAKYGMEKGTAIHAKKTMDSRCSLENMVRRHGESEGTRRWEQLIEKRRKKISIAGFLELYGVDGAKRWEKYCDDRRYCASLQYFVEKHGEVKGREVWERRNRNIGVKNALNKSLPFNTVSQESINFFDELCGAGNLTGAMYGDREWIFYLTTEQARVAGQNIIRPDFLLGKKIIEYHGSRWHANPEVYRSSDMPNPYRKGMTAQEIWDKDSKRLEVLLSMGYEVKVVWDIDCANIRAEVIQDCINYLKGA